MGILYTYCMYIVVSPSEGCQLVVSVVSLAGVRVSRRGGGRLNTSHVSGVSRLSEPGARPLNLGGSFMRGVLATIGAVAVAAGAFAWGACGGGEESAEIEGPAVASGIAGSARSAPERQLIELDDFYIEATEIT